MGKWTPGPWTHDKQFPRDIKNPDGGYLATAWYFGNKGDVSKDESEANANLIAAAPEMYDALSIIAEYFKLSVEATGCGEGMLSIAEAALKKVRGE